MTTIRSGRNLIPSWPVLGYRSSLADGDGDSNGTPGTRRDAGVDLPRLVGLAAVGSRRSTSSRI
jgi:hypothetical protein